MKYTVLLEASDAGYAVSVPGLPGCHSQGETEAEALANIADALRDYLDVVHDWLDSQVANSSRLEGATMP